MRQCTCALVIRMPCTRSHATALAYCRSMRINATCQSLRVMTNRPHGTVCRLERQKGTSSSVLPSTSLVISGMACRPKRSQARTKLVKSLRFQLLKPCSCSCSRSCSSSSVNIWGLSGEGAVVTAMVLSLAPCQAGLTEQHKQRRLTPTASKLHLQWQIRSNLKPKAWSCNLKHVQR